MGLSDAHVVVSSRNSPSIHLSMDFSDHAGDNRCDTRWAVGSICCGSFLRQSLRIGAVAAQDQNSGFAWLCDRRTPGRAGAADSRADGWLRRNTPLYSDRRRTNRARSGTEKWLSVPI